MSNFWPEMVALQVGSGATRTTYTTFDFNLTLDAYYCGQKLTFYSMKKKLKNARLTAAEITETGLVLKCGEGFQNLTTFNYNLTLNASYCGGQEGEYLAKRQSNAGSGRDVKFALICLVIVAVTLVL